MPSPWQVTGIDFVQCLIAARNSSCRTARLQDSIACFRSEKFGNLAIRFGFRRTLTGIEFKAVPSLPGSNDIKLQDPRNSAPDTRRADDAIPADGERQIQESTKAVMKQDASTMANI